MEVLKTHSLRLAWIVAVVGTLGSLYFSEIAGYAPCMLCWYQRIVMYPLVIILPIGIYKKDNNVISYAYPLAIIGLIIAIYQNLLYYHVLPELSATCRLGVSCTAQYINWLGFITIPLLALFGFVFIIGFLYVAQKQLANQR